MKKHKKIFKKNTASLSTIYDITGIDRIPHKKEYSGDVTYTPQTDSQNIEALILDFKDKLDNHLKDGTTYAADSAVWYVEALLNYTYGDASTPCINPTMDTVERSLNSTGANGYTLQQLAEVYDDIKDEVMANEPENSHVYAINLFAYPAGNLTVFATHTAYATNHNSSYKSLADTAGYWYWGAEKGMCGADSGLYVGTDASEIIQDIINSTVVGDYFTGLESAGANYFITNYIDPNFPFNDDYLLPYRHFVAEDETGAGLGALDFCLSPEHIDYYCSEDGIFYIIDDLCPVRKEFAYIIIDAGACDGVITMHSLGITYGTPVNN